MARRSSAPEQEYVWERTRVLEEGEDGEELNGYYNLQTEGKLWEREDGYLQTAAELWILGDLPKSLGGEMHAESGWEGPERALPWNPAGRPPINFHYG
ncbi:hypothetical protein KM043_004423 [Ampulex compressa]|nr:hypothetical protein KM043_004423 [Ampulex compressa]